MTQSNLDQNKTDEFTLVDHLAELRTRLIYCAYGLLVATALAYSQSDRIFNFVRAPIAPYLPNQGLVYTGPLDKFIAHIKLSIVVGFIISCPYWLYHVWKFVAPGLYKKEKNYAAAFISSGTGLFLTGAAFSYFVVLPMAFKFLFSFGGDTDKPMITIESYFDFFTQMCLIFGLSFELPLVIAVLGMLGIVSQNFLKQNRRYAIMTLAIICAIVTPPDLMSMVMMLIPMILLFEIGVFFVGFFERKRIENEFT